MAAGGGVGLEIDLARVPALDQGMTAYEILLSESQERMLVVAKADRVAQVEAIAAKWELGATAIGRVTEDRKSTRLNSSHMSISYAVFCLKKKKNNQVTRHVTSQPAHRLQPLSSRETLLRRD